MKFTSEPRRIRLLTRVPLNHIAARLGAPSTTAAPLKWSWSVVIVAPTGEEISWTASRSKPAAVSALLNGHDNLWPTALINGYSLRWLKEEIEVAE